MLEELSHREQVLRDFFGLKKDVHLLPEEVTIQDIPLKIADHLKCFNLEWHIIPAAAVVPFDEAYIQRFYRLRARDFNKPSIYNASLCEALKTGNQQHQGKLLAIETSQKPRYHLDNHQFYGTHYGYDATADPFAQYLGRAGFTNGTRYSHNYLPLREFVNLVNEEWRTRKVMPEGYRLTICPPAVFNLIGTVFHQEWSETESLELGYYRDQSGNAACYAVGSNAPGDYSYVQRIEKDSDWRLLGFRMALVPETLT